MDTLVVGAGEMGRWFAGALADGADTPVSFAFADTDPAVAEAAAERHGGHAVGSDTDERFDLVVVAVPIPAAEVVIERYADRTTGGVIDLAGVMDGPLAAMRAAAPDRERASLHPLFAAENAPGTVAAVVDNDGPVLETVRTALTACGNTWAETTAEEHDRAMETVQAAAHTAVLAFGLAAANVPEQFHTPVSAALFDVLSQVTGNDPRVYADIQSAFDGADAVADAAARIADADAEAFADLYAEAGR